LRFGVLEETDTVLVPGTVVTTIGVPAVVTTQVKRLVQFLGVNIQSVLLVFIHVVLLTVLVVMDVLHTLMVTTFPTSVPQVATEVRQTLLGTKLVTHILPVVKVPMIMVPTSKWVLTQENLRLTHRNVIVSV